MARRGKKTLDAKGVVEALDALQEPASERNHLEADGLLVDYLRGLGPPHDAIADAYDRASYRCDFWYS